MSKTCCFVGHYDINVDYVREEIDNHIILAIQNGYKHFISGFVGGVDLYFVDIVAEIRKGNPRITLEAAIPYRERLQTKDKAFQKHLKLCDEISIITETFDKNCYFVRNMYMANRSEQVIAVYDGREYGSTAFTVLYSQVIGRELRIINIGKNRHML